MFFLTLNKYVIVYLHLFQLTESERITLNNILLAIMLGYVRFGLIPHMPVLTHMKCTIMKLGHHELFIIHHIFTN